MHILLAFWLLMHTSPFLFILTPYHLGSLRIQSIASMSVNDRPDFVTSRSISRKPMAAPTALGPASDVVKDALATGADAKVVVRSIVGSKSARRQRALALQAQTTQC